MIYCPRRREDRATLRSDPSVRSAGEAVYRKMRCLFYTAFPQQSDKPRGFGGRAPKSSGSLCDGIDSGYCVLIEFLRREFCQIPLVSVVVVVIHPVVDLCIDFVE